MTNKPLTKTSPPITRRRLAIIFTLLALAAIFVIMAFTATKVIGTTVYVPESDNPNIIHSKVPSDGSSPSDHNALDNLTYAAERIYSSRYFRGETYGTVVSDIGFIKHLQNVHNVRVVKGDCIFAESVSSSTLKSVAEQKFFAGDTILYRPATEVNGESASFADYCSKMELEEFYATYGVIPNEITKHIINAETILSIRDENATTKAPLNSDAYGGEVLFEIPQTLVKGDDGNYRFTLVLDPDGSTKFYRNEVMTLAGANYINFKSVELTFTIDENWYPISVLSNEVYDLSIPSFSFMGMMTMTSSLTETFSDIDADGEIPEYAFFSEHFNTDNTESGSHTLSASDYLGEAFGPYLAGKDLELEAEITINGKSLGDSVKLSVNIDTMLIKAKFGGLSVQYSDDRIYITNNKLKGYVSVDKITELLKSDALSSLIGNIDLGGLLDESLLGTVMANCTMTSDGGVTTVRMPFSLKDGIDIDAALIISDNDMALKAISGTINLNGTEIAIKATPKSAKFPTIDGSYKDISGVLDFVPAALGTVLDETTYGITGHVDIMGYAADVDAYVDRTDGITVEAAVKILGQEVTLKYIDGVLYAELYNIKAKAAGEDIPELISAITELIDIDTSLFDRIKPLLPDTIPEYINVLGNIDVNSDKLKIELNLLGAPAYLELSRTSDRLSALKLDFNLNILDKSVNLNADLSLSAPKKRSVKAIGTYVDLIDIVPILPHLTKYIEADGLGISIAASIAGSATVNVAGDVKLAYVTDGGDIKGVTLSGYITAFGNRIDITVTDGTLYAAIGNIKLKLAFEDADDIVAAVGRLINLVAPLELDIDVDEILKSITINAVQGGTLGVSADILGTNATINVTPETGDVLVTCVSDSIKASASATVTPLKGIKPHAAPAGAAEYVDIVEFTDTIDAVSDIIEAKSFTAPVSVTVDGFTVSAKLALDFGDGLALKLDKANIPLSLTYVDGTAYITVGGVKLSCDKTGLDALIGSLGSILPDSVSQFTSGSVSVDVAAVLDTVISAVKRFAVNDGNATLDIGIDGISASALFATDLSLTAIDLSIGETSVHAELGAILPGAPDITKPDGDFIPAEKLAAVIGAVLPLAKAEGYKLSLNGSMYGADIIGSVTLALPVPETETEEAKPFGLSVELDIADIKGISLTIADGILYVVIPDTVSVACGLSDGELGSIIDEIKSALPDGEANDTVCALTDIIDTLASADALDIIGALYGYDTEDGFVLGCDFNSLGADLAASVTVSVDGTLKGLSVSVDTLEKALSLDMITWTDGDGVLKIVTAYIGDSTDVTVKILSRDKQEVYGKAGCISISTYSQLISPILSLIEAHGDAKTISLSVDASIIKKTTGNYVDIECNDITVTFGQSVAVRAVLTLFSTTDDAQDVIITYVDGTVYVEAGTVALSFDTDEDIERIYTVLEKYLPAYLAEELKNLLGLGDGTSSFSEIGLLIDRIQSIVDNPTVGNVIHGLFTDLGALYGKSAALTILDMIEFSAVDSLPVIHATVMGITLKITPILTEGDDEINAQLVGAEISTEVIGMILRVKAYDLVSYTSETEIPVPSDRQYVSIMEFVRVVDMAIGTFTTVNPLEKDEITFEIPSFSFTFDKYATETDPADTITVTGKGDSALKGKFTKHTETDENGEASSTFGVSLEAHISLDILSKAASTGAIEIDLYVIDRYPDSPVAYLGYVEKRTGYGELVSIDFTSVMQILAAVMDIIGVDDDTVEELVGPYRLPIDTSVFEHMSIMGLDSVKDLLNTLASTINKAEIALDEIITAVDIIKNAGSFDGLRDSLDDIKSHISAAVELFGISLDTDDEQYEGSAVDGSMFKRIVGGVAFGNDEYNLWADIANEITTGADGIAKINVTSDGNVLNEVSVHNLDALTSHVDMFVSFVAGGAVEMSPAPKATDYTSANVDYSDLGNIKHLLFDIMNTANLAEFEIGGENTNDKIDLKLSIIKIINDSITFKYNVKVKLLTKADRIAMGLTVTDDEPEIKTAATVELIYNNCSAAGIQVVGDCTTRLYFFDDLIYIDGVRSWEEVTRGGFLGIGGTKFYDCKREYKIFTLDDLSAMFEDPAMTSFFDDFLFLLVPLKNDGLVNLQKIIKDEVAKSATEESTANPTIATVFKGYSYDGAKHTATIGLKELTGSDALSDITVSLTGANDGDDNILDNYVTAAQIKTGQIGVSAANVTVNLTATLRNVEEYLGEEETRMIRTKGLTSYTVHDVYLDKNKNDTGKNISYPDIMSLLLGELPIAGSTTNPWQHYGN